MVVFIFSLLVQTNGSICVWLSYTRICFSMRLPFNTHIYIFCSPNFVALWCHRFCCWLINELLPRNDINTIRWIGVSCVVLFTLFGGCYCFAWVCVCVYAVSFVHRHVLHIWYFTSYANTQNEPCIKQSTLSSTLKTMATKIAREIKSIGTVTRRDLLQKFTYATSALSLSLSVSCAVLFAAHHLIWYEHKNANMYEHLPLTLNDTVSEWSVIFPPRSNSC